MTSPQWLASYLEQGGQMPGVDAPDTAMAGAWMKGPRGLIAIGTFHLRGPGTVELWSAVSLAGYPTITVTQEPEDGNPASSGQVVLSGS